MNIYVIGAGGVASYLLPVLTRSIGPGDEIVIMDGDKLEERNLDRQLFSAGMVGEYKARALAEMYNVEYINAYLRAGAELSHEENDWLIVAADNHKARRVALEIADQQGFRVLIGANEYTDSEAYYYEPLFRGTNLDPRIKWPEMLSDNSGDPTSCTGEGAGESAPQLAIANMLAAAFIMHLFYFHTQMSGKVGIANHPIHHSSNFAKIKTETK